MIAGHIELLLDTIGDRGFAGAGKAGEPDNGGRLLFERRAIGLSDEQCSGDEYCFRAEARTPPCRRRPFDCVNRSMMIKDPVFRLSEYASNATGVVAGDVTKPDIVERERFRGQMLPGIDIDFILDRGDACRNGLCPDTDKICPSRKKRRLVHPEHVGGELLGDLRSRVRRREDVAPGDIELVREGERHGLAAARPLPSIRRK